VHGQDVKIMPKLKTHKGMKKRFKVSANGKVLHKRCGSSHLNSHKSGKQIRRLRKKSTLDVSAENRRVRNALLTRQAVNPLDVEAQKLAAQAAQAEARTGEATAGSPGPAQAETATGEATAGSPGPSQAETATGEAAAVGSSTPSE
jgi:large subunit ribosomal protein L35